ncbi:hypothetical protein [Mycobacterium scrofulaceum]|uniref:hypothetical protein n=1 Tax=Mycobacterium scrofulaceum TaxID=1783 RepID=UPI001150D485|nr:hypothetical protein [Mycobacterium scrofulaceum]
MSARVHSEIMEIARTKNFEARGFTPDEASRIEWLNSEGNRLEAEREAIDRAMLAEMRNRPADPGADAAAKLAELRALPYAPVPTDIRRKQLELARQPIRDPQRALEILERKKREGDAYPHIFRVIAERAYADRPYSSWASSRPGVTWRPTVRDRGLRPRVRAPWVPVNARKAHNA